MQYNSRVIIKKDAQYSYLGSFGQLATNNSLIGRTITNEKYNYSSNNLVSVYFLEGYNLKHISIKFTDLVELTEEEIEIYKQKEEDYVKEFMSKEYTFKQKLLTPIETTFKDLDIKTLLELPKYTGEYCVYVDQGKIAEDFTMQDLYRSYYKQSCCDFIKEDYGFIYYIPEYLLRIWNYSEQDLIAWLKFIKRCQIDFDYQFDGLIDFPKHILDKLENNAYKDSSEELIVNGEYVYPLKETKCYKIVVKQGAYKWHNYLHLLLIRYVHHYCYHSIPALAMQIKDELKEKTTCWQALLMAHLGHYTSGSNGLISQNPDFYLNIFQTRKSVLENLQTKGMNVSFETVAKYDKEHCKQLIEKKEYQTLLDYLKKHKNENK